ncbi:MAG: hypothetical protein AAF497_02890 [Planctomycetota bacterium]
MARQVSSWFRFSVRGLILTMTVSSILFAFVVQPVKDARDQQLALRRIAQLKGTAEPGMVVDAGRRLGHSLAERIYQGSATAFLYNVDLTDTAATDEDIRLISRMRFLRSLNLTNTQVSDLGIEHLNSQRKLHHLDISGTKVTDTGIQSLSKVTSLKSMQAMDCDVSDTALRQLTHGARIIEQRAVRDLMNTSALVGLYSQPGDDKSGKSDEDPLRDVVYLVATPKSYFIDEDFFKLVNKLHTLPELILESAKFGENRLGRLSQPSLETLTLRDMDLMDEDLQDIVKLKSLKRLHIENCNQLTGSNLVLLENLPNLRLLTIKDCANVADATLRSLANRLVQCDCDFEYRTPMQTLDSIDVYSKK